MPPKTVTTATLDAWLQRHKISRQALADMLMIAKGTVDNWFSQKHISLHKQKMLRPLMDCYDLGANAADTLHSRNQDEDFTADASLFSSQEWECIRQAALLEHKSPASLIKEVSLSFCKRIYQAQSGNDA